MGENPQEQTMMDLLLALGSLLVSSSFCWLLYQVGLYEVGLYQVGLQFISGGFLSFQGSKLQNHAKVGVRRAIFEN